MILAFDSVLREKSADQIKFGFETWLRRSDVMPRPANILKIIESEYRIQAAETARPKNPEPEPEKPKKWEDLTEHERENCVLVYLTLGGPVAEIYRRVFDIPEIVIENITSEKRAELKEP